MAAKHYKWLFTFPAILLLIFIFSCSVERKIAREFIKDDSTRTALVMPPDFLFKTSLKDYEFEEADSIDEYQLDSLLFENSIFLKNIDDSSFIAGYYKAYYEELQKLGFRLYEPDSLLSFLNGKPGSYIFNLAQLELEEYVMPIVEKQAFDEYLYYQVLNLNAININSWIEISRMNEEEKKRLFFSSLYITDEIEGYFKYNFFTGDVKYDYSQDTLMLEEIYGLGKLAGYIYAGYTFDYLLNLYIDSRMESENLQRSAIYFHYDREKKWLLPAGEDQRFIPMDDEN